MFIKVMFVEWYRMGLRLACNKWGSFQVAKSLGTTIFLCCFHQSRRLVDWHESAIRVKPHIRDFHLLIRPVDEAHTGLLYFNVLQSLLTGICENGSCQNLSSVATEGRIDMKGSLQASVSGFNGTFSDSFYRIWCGVHRLHLIIQNIFSHSLKPRVRDSLIAVV